MYTKKLKNIFISYLPFYTYIYIYIYIYKKSFLQASNVSYVCYMDHLNFFKYNIFCFHECKYSKNMINNQSLKENLMELENRELKDREEKNKRKIEELFYKPIIMCKDDMDKFEEQEMKRIRQVKKQMVSSGN